MASSLYIIRRRLLSVAFPGLINRLGNRHKLFTRELQLRIGEKHIQFFLNRNQMNVRMRYFKANHRFTHLLTWESLLNSQCYTLCKDMHCCHFIIFQIKNVIYFALRNHQSMAFHQWIDVQKRIKLFILRYLVARNFTCDNSTEYCCLI